MSSKDAPFLRGWVDKELKNAKKATKRDKKGQIALKKYRN